MILSLPFFRLFCLVLILTPFSWGEEIKTPIMPLSEVKPGMKGEWRTVVSGTKIESFPLEVVDVIPTFVGPKQPVIFCRALDDHQKDIGTVAGMSGSPVYIDGKLVGAYAYGFPWPKDQALVGLSPIEEMLKVLAYGKSSTVMGQDGSHIPEGAPGPLPLNQEEPRGLKPVPLLLSVAGFSSSVLSDFSSEWEGLGFTLNALSAVGGDEDHALPLVSDDSGLLAPGSAVAAVLLGGDFKVAAAGTVTWKEGDTLLAMGHPFLSQGGVRIPMAAAEIVDIVQSYETSFKLAKIGPTVGSFFQDRLTAMAGEVGVFAPVTQLLFNVTTPKGDVRSYKGDLFQNRDLGPLVAAMALSQTIQSTLDAAFEQSYVLKTRIEVEGFAPIIQSHVAYGPSGASTLAKAFLNDFRLLLNNRFEFPKVKAVTFDIILQEGIKRVELLEVQVISGKPKPGGVLALQLKLKDFLGPIRKSVVHIPLPRNRHKGAVEVRVGGAEMADVAYEGDDPRLGFRSLADVITYLRSYRSNDSLYIQLVQEAPGMQLGGQAMADMPKSVFSLYETPKAWFKAGFLDVQVLHEVILPQGGSCVGGPCILGLNLDN